MFERTLKIYIYTPYGVFFIIKEQTFNIRENFIKRIIQMSDSLKQV